MALACLNDAHDDCCRLSTFFGACKQPVLFTEDEGLDAPFATIIADLDKWMVQVNEQGRPAIKGVCNSFAEFCFWRLNCFSLVKPFFQLQELRLSDSLTKILPLIFSHAGSNPLNVEEAFDYAHRVLYSFFVRLPSIFKVAMNMRPAVCSSSTFFDYRIVFVGSISLEDSLKSPENLLWIHGMLGVGVIVEDVSMLRVAAVSPDEASVRFAESLFQNGESGGIGLQNSTFEAKFVHSANNRKENVCDSLEPTAHGSAIEGNALGLEDLLLAVQRQMEPEFVGCYFSEEPRTGNSFVNWLIGFLSCNQLTMAFVTRILEHDVPNIFKYCFDKFKLVGNLKADNFSGCATAWTRKFFWFDSVFFGASCDGFGRSGAATTMLTLWNNIQPAHFTGELCLGLQMDSLSSAGEKRGVDLCRLLTKCHSVSPRQLFFQFFNTLKELLNEGMAIRKIVRSCL